MKSKTYEEFVDKFKPKLTTDDCYTPAPVYDAVKSWVCKEYGVKEEDIVRPFWPGADYEATEYPDGCVVLDNPPFSILSKIFRFFLDRGIKFFLFAPSLTALSGKDICMRINHIICCADIVYENGANVLTAFVTNLGDGETVLQTAPELGKTINDVCDRLRAAKTFPKYEYPDHVVTAAMAQRYSKYGCVFRVKRSECVRISSLDHQKETGKAIFGSGLLLSTEAAERKRKAEEESTFNRFSAEKERTVEAKEWKLSDRERAIVAKLDQEAAHV